MLRAIPLHVTPLRATLLRRLRCVRLHTPLCDTRFKVASTAERESPPADFRLPISSARRRSPSR